MTRIALSTLPRSASTLKTSTSRLKTALVVRPSRCVKASSSAAESPAVALKAVVSKKWHAPTSSGASYMLPASMKSASVATCPYVSCEDTCSPFGSVVCCSVGDGRRWPGRSAGSPDGTTDDGSEVAGTGSSRHVRGAREDDADGDTGPKRS